MAETKLKLKQEKFVQEYMIDGNATKAALRAGYSEKTAYSQGQRLLKKAEIQAKLAAEQASQRKRLQVSQDWVLIRLKKISDRCMQEEAVMAYDKAKGEWVATGEYQFDSKGAIRATELIGKHLGMFTERVELSGSISIEQALREMQEGEEE